MRGAVLCERVAEFYDLEWHHFRQGHCGTRPVLNDNGCAADERGPEVPVAERASTTVRPEKLDRAGVNPQPPVANREAAEVGPNRLGTAGNEQEPYRKNR